jgi:hypothetical protein
MFHRVVLTGLLLASCTGLVFAQPFQLLYDDIDFSTWELRPPPTGSGTELVLADEPNPYLSLRHRHVALHSSALTSYLSAPGALYDPAARGAVNRFAVSARFRARFEGQEIFYYAIRSMSVYATIAQDGVTYVSQVPIFGWGGTVPQGVWWPRILGFLAATDFSGPIAGSHPDFSEHGAPMTLGLAVTSGFQSSSDALFEHLFQVDVDDFRVEFRPPIGTGPLSIYIPSSASYFSTVRGNIPFSVVETESSATNTGAGIELSRASATPIPFVARLGGSTIASTIPEGRTSYGEQFAVSRGDYATIFELLSAEGATIGDPRALILLVYDLTKRCAITTQARWRADLRRLGYALGDPPPAAKRVPRSGGLESDPTAGSTPLPAGDSTESDLETLRAVRDEVMSTTAAGRYYSELYTTHSLAIVRTLVTSPALLADLFVSQDAWIAGLGSLVGGSGASAITVDMVEDLNRLLDGFEASGSPALRRTLARERTRLGLDSIGGLSVGQFWQRVNERWSPETCTPYDLALCLGGRRYRVEADWKTPAGATGRAHAVALSGDSGYFWFFDPANVELLTKIVDGCGANQRTWSYSAGLTNLEVELFVFDTATGRGKSYRNPQATSFAPVLDSDYLECVPAPSAAEVSASTAMPTAPVNPQPLGAGSCLPGATTLCLGGPGGGRFRVEADWRTAAGASGAARAVPLTDDTGTFWFFNAANIELVVKTIDACGLAGFENYWVFAGGTTDVEVTMRVTDTLLNVSKTYRRPLGVPFAPILDSAAFATCP